MVMYRFCPTAGIRKMESKEIFTDFIETQFLVFSNYFYRDKLSAVYGRVVKFWGVSKFVFEDV